MSEFIKGQELTKEDYRILSRLQENKDFQHFRKIVEVFQQQRAYNLITGSERERGVVVDELYGYRGGALLWNKLMELIDSADTAFAELQKNEEEQNKRD